MLGAETAPESIPLDTAGSPEAPPARIQKTRSPLVGLFRFALLLAALLLVFMLVVFILRPNPVSDWSESWIQKLEIGSVLPRGDNE